MRLFIFSAALAALFIAPAAHAAGTTQVALTIKGALISIPNSDITIERGQNTSFASAVGSHNGVLTIRLTSSTPSSGFVIKGLSLTEFSVTFMPKGQTKAVDIDPNLIGTRSYTYLPLPGAMGGGTFTITLPSPPGLAEKKSKGFLD